MKRKLGDKVRVKDNLKVGKTYGAARFVQQMEQYRGKEFTIRLVFSRSYSLEGISDWDVSDWVFSDEMLEPAGTKKPSGDWTLVIAGRGDTTTAKLITDDTTKTAEVKRHRADTYDRKAAITAVVDKLLKPDEPKFKPGDIVEVRGAHGLPDGVRGRIDGGRGIYGAWLVDFGVKYPCTHRGTGDILPDPTGWYCLETDLKKVEG